MHYSRVVFLRTLAVVLAVWPMAYAINRLWTTANFMAVLPAVSGLLVGYGLWYLANRMIERKGSEIPY